ncbi:unnamed protein product [Heligmosomoides polygyrus]|uniref:Secreted protein n=1 Tax=Heligmosomoides polygyrus TaxID=6339 RepID=A0A183GSD9_HELPZ|nr:unnamed protein product [Heligmosomoides polygyrus]
MQITLALLCVSLLLYCAHAEPTRIAGEYQSNKEQMRADGSVRTKRQWFGPWGGGCCCCGGGWGGPWGWGGGLGLGLSFGGLFFGK